MSKATLYICDRCKREGKEGFSGEIRFTYGTHYDGQETSNSDSVVDLCGNCARLCLTEVIKLLGYQKTYEYIQTKPWLKADKALR